MILAKTDAFETNDKASPTASDDKTPATSRRQVALAAAIEERQKELETTAQLLRDLTGHSAELVTKRMELAILSDHVKSIVKQIHTLDLEMKQKPRVQLVQNADTKGKP